MGETNSSSGPTDMTSAFQRTWKEIAWKKRLVVPFGDNYAKIVCFPSPVLTSNRLFM